MSDRLQSRLTASLSAAQIGADHPEPEMLNAFREHRLHSRSREVVANHLSCCPFCRDILSLSAAELPPRPRRAYTAAFIAAAAMVVMLAGTTSTIDSGIVFPNLPELAQRVRMLPGSRLPKFSYAVAEVNEAASTTDWRIRNSALETSGDFGKTWRPANLERSFEAETVQHSGSDVWVRSRSGELALSRDGGVHWTFLKPTKGR